MTDIQKIYHIEPWSWPDNAADITLKALQNSDTSEEDRLLAAKMAGDFTIINDDLAEALLEVVSDNSKPEKLRAQAVLSFGPALEYIESEGFEDIGFFDDFEVTEPMYNRIQKTLKTLYFDAAIPTYVRRRVLEASVRAPQPWHDGAIRAAYRCGKDDWMLTAVFCMMFVQGFQQEILEALQNKKSAIKDQAIEAIGAWGISDAWPSIVEILRDSHADRDSLFIAINAAISIEHPEINTALHELLDSSDAEVADAATEALAMLEMGFFGEAEDDDDDW